MSEDEYEGYGDGFVTMVSILRWIALILGTVIIGGQFVYGFLNGPPTVLFAAIIQLGLFAFGMVALQFMKVVVQILENE